MGSLFFDGFQGGDNGLEDVGDLAVGGCQAGVVALLGEVDELEGVVALTAMDGQECRGGLEVRTRQAGVGVGAVLLGRAPAVAVGQAGLGPGEVVLDPLRFALGASVEREAVTVDVDAPLLVVVERGPDGGVMDRGIAEAVA